MGSTAVAIAATIGEPQFDHWEERERHEPSIRFLLERRNDPAARDALLRRITPRVKRIASRFRPPRAADFDDVLQVGLIAATDAIAIWDPSGAPFVSHLAMTVHYRIIDYVRMRAHHKERGFDDALSDGSPSTEGLLTLLPSGEPGPEEVLLARERVSMLAAVIRRLPPRKRTALLGMMNEKTPREIDPEASENTIYASASAARRRLKLALAKM
jgi:RNA polymerase sigma factor (sigma-70 family)